MATSNTSTHGFPHTISRLHVVSRQYLQYSLCALKLNIVEHIIYIVVYSAPHVAITFIQMLACITIGIQSFTFNQFIFRQYTHTHTHSGALGDARSSASIMEWLFGVFPLEMATRSSFIYHRKVKQRRNRKPFHACSAVRNATDAISRKECCYSNVYVEFGDGNTKAFGERFHMELYTIPMGCLILISTQYT